LRTISLAWPQTKNLSISASQDYRHEPQAPGRCFHFKQEAKLSVVAHGCIQHLGEAEAGDHKFETSLGYTERPHKSDLPCPTEMLQEFYKKATER
jgi:hypothetical protein